MGKLLGSSAERRLQAFRRDLTLDLFTRHGLFWVEVCWLRDLRGITAESRLPPTLHPGKVHRPPTLKATNWEWRPEQRQALAEWMVLLHVLHDAVVPPEHRVETPHASSLEFWMGFLSACLLYDPPASNLLGFADHGVAAYGDFVNPLTPWADERGALGMLAPPIRFLPDPDALLAAHHRRHERFVDELHRRLTPDGIDVRGLADEIGYWVTDDANPTDDLATLPRPYIAVDPQTTEEDVRNAFKLMAAAQPERRRPVRPRRDRLVCLQCAIWYDEGGWSQERIAAHFGWKVQFPAQAKPRSETARLYIAEGRQLLHQRRIAA
jgi:hypothetical protein